MVSVNPTKNHSREVSGGRVAPRWAAAPGARLATRAVVRPCARRAEERWPVGTGAAPAMPAGTDPTGSVATWVPCAVAAVGDSAQPRTSVSGRITPPRRRAAAPFPASPRLRRGRHLGDACGCGMAAPLNGGGEHGVPVPLGTPEQVSGLAVQRRLDDPALGLPEIPAVGRVQPPLDGRVWREAVGVVAIAQEGVEGLLG